MSYVEKTLAPGEEIIYQARFPWIYTLNSLLALILLGWFFLFGVFIFFERMIRKWTTEIVVTNHRLIIKTGWISRHVRELNLTTIEEIKLNQSFWGGVLGYGSLDIRGTGEGNIQLPNIDNPKAFNVAISSARTMDRDSTMHRP